MSLHRPIDAHYDHGRGLVKLFYDNGEWIDADVRGAICWPTMSKLPVKGVITDDIAGYVLIGVFNVRTGQLFIAEQQRFSTIKSIFSPDGAMRHKGLARWFVEVAWAKYYCNDFYWASQEDDLAKKYRVETSMEQGLEPPPQFVRLHIADESNTVWSWIKHGKLAIPAKTQLQVELITAKTDDKGLHGGLIALHALKCLLTSYDSYPWREQYAH